MCEMSEERTYYIRTSLMYTDLTREVLFKVFRYLIKSDDITGFLSSPEQQKKLRELLQRHVLNQPDYNIVSCQALNLERFDISLLVRLILNLCKDNIPQPQRGWETKQHPKDESLGADLLRLRDVRNKIIGHRADAKLSEAEYEKTWATIKAVLLRVVELVDSQSSELFEQRLNGYKRLNVDTENDQVKRLLDELHHYKIEFDHIQEKVEELRTRSKEFEEYFKITPEIFERYIKLLFDGGRIVLCGTMKTKLGDQDLSGFLERKKETLIRNIDKKYSRCLYSQESCSDYEKWDVLLLASVLLLTCNKDLSEKEIMYIERIKSARVNYAALALQSLDTVEFLTSWTDLINCLNHLSINIAEDDKQQVENLIEHYKKKDERGCDADEYFKQLRESGVEVKTLNDVYKEIIEELRDMMNQLRQKDFKFENGFVLEFKLMTICENEEIKKEAEDLLEINLQASVQKSDQPSGSIRKETDKVVAIIAAHPDVTPFEVKRKCIIWSFKCYTPGGLVHILDITHGDQFRSTFRNIAIELHYIYGYAFLIQGKCTLESVSGVSRMLNKSTTNEASSEHISIPLKCTFVDGINSVLSAIKMEKTTNCLNRIAEQMSAEFKETVSIKLIPEMMEFRNVLEETDSEGSSSLGINEDETEEVVPIEIGNENDKENMEEQVDFIIDNKCTLMHADETNIDLVRGHADDEKNEVFAAQQLYDEKIKEYTMENEEAERNIKTLKDTFKTISLGQTRIRDVTVGEKRTENKLVTMASKEHEHEHATGSEMVDDDIQIQSGMEDMSIDDLTSRLDIFKKPQQLISTDQEGQLKVDTNVLSQFSKINMKINVICVCGSYRSGKSYLMNRIAGDKTGFDLGHTVHAKTKGIWIWCRQHPTQSDQVLVLLDTEGFGDLEKADTEHDKNMFCLALLMSSTLIINIKSVIEYKTLKELNFIAKLPETIKVLDDKAEDKHNAKTIQVAFPTLIICIRDFFLDIETDGRLQTANEYLENSLKSVDLSTSSEKQQKKQKKSNKVKEGIKAYFQKRKCFTIAQPASNENLKNIETLDETSLDKSFVKNIKALQSYVYGRKPKYICNVSKKPLQGPDFTNLITSYVNALKTGSTLKCQEAYGQAAFKRNERVLNKVLTKFKKDMNKLQYIENKEKLQTEFLPLFEKACSKYRDDSFVYLQDKYEEKLQAEMIAYFDMMKNEIDKTCMENGTEALSKMYDEMQKRNSKYLTDKATSYSNYEAEMDKLKQDFFEAKKLYDKDVLLVCFDEFLKSKSDDKMALYRDATGQKNKDEYDAFQDELHRRMEDEFLRTLQAEQIRRNHYIEQQLQILRADCKELSKSVTQRSLCSIM